LSEARLERAASPDDVPEPVHSLHLSRLLIHPVDLLFTLIPGIIGAALITQEFFEVNSYVAAVSPPPFEIDVELAVHRRAVPFCHGSPLYLP
jgi:hypothetical protein